MLTFILCRRINDYIRLGLDNDIVDPDNGANISRKLAKIQKAGVDTDLHPNLRDSPKVPSDGWSSNLGDLPFVSFATLYKHFVERPIHSLYEESDGSDTEEHIPSFRGLGKGYRFYKDGHVQNIQFHPLPESSEFCFVEALVLPSMLKTKKYSVRLCLTSEGEVHTAYCVCPAGLAGCCNHIAGLLYALEDFVRLGLREESKLPCTSKLQQWNRPRCRKVPPRRVREVVAVKEEYGRMKKAKVHPIYDPRPLKLQLPDPKEQNELKRALREEH